MQAMYKFSLRLLIYFFAPSKNQKCFNFSSVRIFALYWFNNALFCVLIMNLIFKKLHLNLLKSYPQKIKFQKDLTKYYKLAVQTNRIKRVKASCIENMCLYIFTGIIWSKLAVKNECTVTQAFSVINKTSTSWFWIQEWQVFEQISLWLL